MKKPNPIDFDQRPECYWNDEDVLAKLLRGFRDSEQRGRITTHWTNGDIEKLPAEIGTDGSADLAEGFMRECMPWEKEIAIISLESVHGDTISVRAIKSRDKIHYKVVDEHGSDFKLQREASDQPLTLQEMISFLDQTSLEGLPGGISLGYNRMNAGYSTRAELRHFTSITSKFYPDLKRHYEAVFEHWANSDED